MTETSKNQRKKSLLGQLNALEYNPQNEAFRLSITNRIIS